MDQGLKKIAEQLRDSNKKVQLIYAFNGTGKTRLSRALKDLVAPKNVDDDGEISHKKILYYNAFTEDLFRWDNGSEGDAKPKLEIKPNSFTDWILKDQGLDQRIIDRFQKLTESKVNPVFNIDEGNITFSIPITADSTRVTFDSTRITADGSTRITADRTSENIKISKGEESNFIWSIFYTLLDQVIEILKDSPEVRETDQLDQLEYVFIDDPVSSLDENHLIELAVSLATLVKSSAYQGGQGLRFVITTHNPLFYNVLWNEFNNDLYDEKPDGSRGKRIYKRDQSKKYRLEKKADGTFEFTDSNDRPFSYHLFLLSELKKIENPEDVEKYHFNFLRNILEKTATFLGYKHWSELLKDLSFDDLPAIERMLNLYSHSAHAGEEPSDPTGEHREKLIELIKGFTQYYSFAYTKKEAENAAAN